MHECVHLTLRVIGGPHSVVINIGTSAHASLAAGIFIPEFLTSVGILDTPSWFTAGKYEYFADAPTLFAVQLALMGWAEARRWADILKPGSVKLVTKPSLVPQKLLAVISWDGVITMVSYTAMVPLL